MVGFIVISVMGIVGLLVGDSVLDLVDDARHDGDCGIVCRLYEED